MESKNQHVHIIQKALFLSPESIWALNKGYCQETADPIWAWASREEGIFAKLSFQHNPTDPCECFVELSISKFDAPSKTFGYEKRACGKGRLHGKWSIAYKGPDGETVYFILEVVPLSPEKALAALRSMVADIRDAWSGGYNDVKAVSGLSSDELRALGFSNCATSDDN